MTQWRVLSAPRIKLFSLHQIYESVPSDERRAQPISENAPAHKYLFVVTLVTLSI
jgi:hypothetical protein